MTDKRTNKLLSATEILTLIPDERLAAIAEMRRKAKVTKKPRLDPMLRRWGIKIPYLRFTFTTPTPEEIRKLRVAAGLTQEQAAASVGLGAAGNIRWAEYENGTRTPDVARWALFLLIIRAHPEWRLKRNKLGHLIDQTRKE